MNDYWNDNTIFNNYVNAFGSKFAAIMYVSKLARKRRKECEYCITESQALAWVISGVEPIEVSLWRSREKEREDAKTLCMQDRIMYIEDKLIRDAVEVSINLSLEAGHLIYRYKGLSNPYQKARVRIICRMIWDELKQIDLSNQL